MINSIDCLIVCIALYFYECHDRNEKHDEKQSSVTYIKRFKGIVILMVILMVSILYPSKN